MPEGALLKQVDLERLIDDAKSALAEDAGAKFGILGHTPVTYDLLRFFREVGASDRIQGIYAENAGKDKNLQIKPLAKLEEDHPAILIVASDVEKEKLLEAAVPYLSAETNILVAGYGNLSFQDPAFSALVQSTLVPSLANGNPHSLVHLFQCIENAARLNLEGVVVEFGVFKGGTTMMLSRFIEHFGRSWKVIGFDTFGGFPPKQSPLDMYAHPDCVFTDEAAVRRYLSDRNVELVSGNLVDTVQMLRTENVVLAFIDTDNYTPSIAILDAIQERIVIGGAIIFDHFTGVDRFRYTLGERMAAKRLLSDNRFFNLHGTGVFLRQR